MNHDKPPTATAMTVPRLNSQPTTALVEPPTLSRHAAKAENLYSYRGYKHWMNNLRATWDKT